MTNSPSPPVVPAAPAMDPGVIIHHCFAGQPDCSGCNECPACHEIKLAIVFPLVFQLMGMSPEQAMPAFVPAYRQALDRLHDLMKNDPQIRTMYRATMLRAPAPPVMAPPAAAPAMPAPPPMPPVRAAAPAPASPSPPPTPPQAAFRSCNVHGEYAPTEQQCPQCASSGFADRIPVSSAAAASLPLTPPVLAEQPERPARAISIPMSPDEIATAGYATDLRGNPLPSRKA